MTVTHNTHMDNKEGAADVDAIERIWADLQAEHKKLIEAFKRDLVSTDDKTAREAWKHIDKAAGIEKAMLIVGKELGL